MSRQSSRIGRLVKWLERDAPLGVVLLVLTLGVYAVGAMMAGLALLVLR
jgi:hypothetical protein